LITGINECIASKTAFVLNELDVGWILEWAERSMNPTRFGSRATFSHEQDLVRKLEALA